ncbi:hypothetical protein G7046_g10106 [Stylonectria norvegica]|nr:hypothetical protein G7046_g10106 [Stylonectria norvegica]
MAVGGGGGGGGGGDATVVMGVVEEEGGAAYLGVLAWKNDRMESWAGAGWDMAGGAETGRAIEVREDALFGWLKLTMVEEARRVIVRGTCLAFGVCVKVCVVFAACRDGKFVDFGGWRAYM